MTVWWDLVTEISVFLLNPYSQRLGQMKLLLPFCWGMRTV
jgi:hypothetical protein